MLVKFERKKFKY